MNTVKQHPEPVDCEGKVLRHAKDAQSEPGLCHVTDIAHGRELDTPYPVSDIAPQEPTGRKRDDYDEVVI
jgi:hypothetical protein